MTTGGAASGVRWGALYGAWALALTAWAGPWEWSVMTPPVWGQGQPSLVAVSAASARAAWAVGGLDNGPARVTPLAIRWDGARWRVDRVPGQGALAAITARTPDDVWTVGGDGSLPLIAHGHANRWAIMRGPTPPGGHGELTSVAALSERDVWAAGDAWSQQLGPRRDLVEHWDGVRWRVLPMRVTSPYDTVVDLAADRDDNVWIIAQTQDAAGFAHYGVRRWDGRGWRDIATPPLPKGERAAAPTRLLVRSPHQVYAVGMAFNSAGNGDNPLIWRWDGRALRREPTPPGMAYLTGIASDCSGELYAVGGKGSRSSYPNPGYALRRDATGRWRDVPTTTDPTAKDVPLLAISGVPGNHELLAVGQIIDARRLPPVLERRRAP